MKNILKRGLASFTSITLVVALLAGINVTNEVKADTVALNNWTFTQGGMYDPNYTEGNEGYIDSVTMNGTNEIIGEWLRGSGEEDASQTINQTQMATQISTGFALGIDNTGYDRQWSADTGYPTDRINPWSIQAAMNEVSIEDGHSYTVSFKAYATKKKYCYVEFSCDIPGATIEIDNIEGVDKQLIALGTTEKTYTYKFTNWVSASKLTTKLMLGAFCAQYDYEGNDVSDIITEEEGQWNGTVYVSDFTIIDNGIDVCPCPGIPTKPQETTTSSEIETTTVDEEKSTEAQITTTTIQKETSSTVVELAKTKVKKATKAKESKKAKISLKKIKGASGYQVQISKKKNFKTVLVKKNVNRASFTISSKKIKKLKKIYVRARAYVKHDGNISYGDWSKAKKIK